MTLEPLLTEVERRERQKRNQDLEVRRQREQQEARSPERRQEQFVSALGDVGSGVQGALDLLAIPDELGLALSELVRQGRENIGLGEISQPGTAEEEQRHREKEEKAQATLSELGGIRSLDDVGPFLGNLVERGRERPLSEALEGALIAGAAGAAATAGRKALGFGAEAGMELLQEATQQVGKAADAGTGVTSKFIPEQLPITNVKPTSLMENVIGLPPIQAGLTRREQAENAVLHLFGRIDNNPISNAPFNVRNNMAPAISNTASRLGLKHDAALRGAFQIDDTGRILSLAGIDPTVPGAPTLADVAARLPRYLESDVLTDGQKAALIALRDDLAPYRALLDDVGLLEDIGQRTDIIEGGFYIPRGRADIEGANFPKIGGRTGRGTKGNLDKAAVFDSQAAGIEAGFEYAGIGQVLTSHARNVGNTAVDAHIATFFKQAVDPITGDLLGETAKMRLFRQNPDLVKEMDGLRKETTRLKSLMTGIDDRTARTIDEFLNGGELDDIDDFAAAISNINVVQGGLNAGATRIEVQDALAAIKGRIQDLRPEWKAALKRAQATPRDQNIIGAGGVPFPGLGGLTFPDEVASAANRMLQGDPTFIKGFQAVIGPFNNLYRALRATGDLSAMGIQGLLGLHSAPAAYGDAMKLMFRSVGDPQSLGKFVIQFDEVAEAAGRPGSDIWTRAGLRMGGADTEFALGRGVPILNEANRAYGFFSDTLRLGWADELLQQELAKGRSLQEIIGSGDLEKLADIANNMTGWSKGRAFGSVGDLVLFAPRFLQSRLTTLTKFMTDGGVQGEAARRSVIRLIGFGVMETVALNEALGNETDFRPMVDGRPNPDFMRVRALGRDWSLFGTWDSLARAVILAAGDDPKQAVRGMASGAVSNAWNFISGQTAIGEEVPSFPVLQDDFDPVEFGKFILSENIVPFAAEEAGESIQQVFSGATQGDVGEVVAGIAAMLGEAAGAKSSPTSSSENRDIARQEVMVERGLDGKFRDLDIDVQHDIDHDPRVQEKTKALFESRRRRGSPYQAYLDERTKLEADFENGTIRPDGREEAGINDLVDRFARSRGSLLQEGGETITTPEGEVVTQAGEDPLFGKAFRMRLGDLQERLSTRKADLRERSSEALEFLDDLDPATNAFDIAFEEYLASVTDPILEDPVTDLYDFDERERRLGALREKHGDLTIDRVERFLDNNDHAVIKQLRADQAIMEPYWRILEDHMADLEQRFPKEFGGVAEDYEKYLLIDPSQRQFDIQLPKFAKVKAAVDSLDVRVGGFTGRQQWLMANDPEIDRLLVKWGYRNSASHPQVILEEAERFEQRQTQGEGLRDLNIQPTVGATR